MPQCDRCSEETEDLTTVDETESWCESCVDDYSFYCAYCETHYSGSAFASVDDDELCRQCARDHTARCSECGERFYRDALCTCEDCDGRYCESCYEDHSHDDEPSPIHEYGYRPTSRFFGSPASKADPFLGVELEVNSSNENDDAEYVLESLGDDHVYLKSDGSLSNGFEIVTHPHTLPEHCKLWSNAFFDDAPDSLRSFRSGECGLHVHISRTSLTPLQLGRMTVFMHSPQNLAFLETLAQRSIERWAHIDAKKKLTTNYSESRYESLNLQPRRTVEIRIFRGNMRRDRVLKAIEFAHSLTIYCRDCGNHQLSHQDFLKWLGAPERQSDYRDLINFCRERGLMAGKQTKGKVQGACNPQIAAMKGEQ